MATEHQDLSSIVSLPACRFGAACTRKNPQHFQDESHPCKYGNDCTRHNPLHFSQYSHPREVLARLRVEHVRPGKKRASDDDVSTATTAAKAAKTAKTVASFFGDNDEEDADDDDEADEHITAADQDTETDDDDVLPLTHMSEGDVLKIPGSGAAVYELRLRGGLHYCTCPGWRNSPGATDEKVCKHLRATLGDAFLAQRASRHAPFSASSSSSSSSSSASASAAQPARRGGGKQAKPKLLLAHTLTDEDIDNWWCSEKLDGVRAYWNGTVFLSRDGNEYVAPPWFVAGLPATPLDGELFGGRQRFNHTVGIVKRLVATDEWNSLTYMVFDAPGIGAQPFERRMEYLHSLRSCNAYLRIVEQKQLRDRAELEAFVDRVVQDGGEGAMVRQPHSAYEGKRSKTLFKVKRFWDEEAEVLAHEPGKGKHRGRLGALKVRLDSGKECFVGTGFLDAERDAPPPIGARVTIKYQELTLAGIPRFPVFLRVRSD